ncbi:hypothetical protein HPP92_004473 [Vanilla planifolia]|uniref:TauD/TfdA-like domain-containing protein n=1 Tax=Vanilla planifolia TaxID=51239 RepID=A0A835S943_VANPL|nr:hypothetical protein HPP92_004473 [Vanilla planifolia]
MEFIESRVAEEQRFGDAAFPKTVLPGDGTDGDLAKLVLTERETLIAALDRYSALLFRGFKVNSVADFELVVEAFGWEAYPVPQKGMTTRTKFSDRVYSTNDAAPEYLINFHHEMSLRPTMPSKVLFYCSEPSPQGGETSLVSSDVVLQTMEQRMPEFVAKAAKLGLFYCMISASDAEAGSPIVINKSWKSALGTQDEAEAVKRATEMLSCNSIRFLGEGRAEVTVGPLNPIGVSGEKRAWLVPLLGYNETMENVSNKFSDGSAVPEEALRIYKEILDENHVNIKWQKGDVLLFDNLVVQHARRPGEPPRLILGSLCK